ncbi:MAG: DNA polymerase III subunit beta [Methylococcales bacterium]|nr:DNA polymerase III subunit beta [Methylococcales bacterium]
MKFAINRDDLLPSLQHLNNIVEKRQTTPVLNNALLNFADNELIMTGTDTELQLVSRLPLPNLDNPPQPVTVPVRKLLDICRNLPASVELRFSFEDAKCRLSSQRSHYQLATLPADDFPEFSAASVEHQFSLPAARLKVALEKTQFCIANQDIRYYLNGLLMHISNSELNWIASDGHRLAIYQDQLDDATGLEKQLIIPRKAIVELLRLLADASSPVKIGFSDNHIQFDLPDVSLSTKLIDARFPDFSRAVDQAFLPPVELPVKDFCAALTRVAVLAAEQKIRGVSLDFSTRDLLSLTLYNQAHEQGLEELTMISPDAPLANIAFNVAYLQEAFSHLDSDTGLLAIASNGSTGKIYDHSPDHQRYFFIVMPMKL